MTPRPYISTFRRNSSDRKIDASIIFGSDSEKLLNACYQVYQDWLYPYAGCYHSPSRPTFSDARALTNVLKDESVGSILKSLIFEWKEDHPEEFAKEQHSRKEWEENHDKQFRIIYGIAKRHGLYLEWLGVGSPCYGDQWIVYKNKKEIACIHCF